MQSLIDFTLKQNEIQKNFQNRVESLGDRHRTEHGAFHGGNGLLVPH